MPVDEKGYPLPYLHLLLRLERQLQSRFPERLPQFGLENVKSTTFHRLRLNQSSVMNLAATSSRTWPTWVCQSVRSHILGSRDAARERLTGASTENLERIRLAPSASRRAICWNYRFLIAMISRQSTTSHPAPTPKALRMRSTRPSKCRYRNRRLCSRKPRTQTGSRDRSQDSRWPRSAQKESRGLDSTSHCLRRCCNQKLFYLQTMHRGTRPKE